MNKTPAEPSLTVVFKRLILFSFSFHSILMRFSNAGRDQGYEHRVVCFSRNPKEKESD